MKRAALYARFSSDLQKDKSIDDQLHACQKLAKRDSLKIVGTFTDRAKSGASMFERDGLLDLMKAAKAKQFDVLIVDALDRLSRDQEDMAGIFKRCQFWGIDINTVNDGIATALHVGIRGITSSMFRTDLAHKVKGGMNGCARQGKIPGALAYGYDAVLGKPGERQINEDEANVVRRIFREYAAGASPRSIAIGLTRDKILSPTGDTAWNMQCILGGGNGRKRGIISNPLYIGELVWGTHRQVQNPDTGRKTIRLNDEKEIIKTAVPHLRIIDQPLWDAANKVRHDRSVAKFGDSRNNVRKVVPRREHLLTGLLRCEACGGSMHIRGGANGVPLVCCVNANTKQTCDHTKTYKLDQLQQTVTAQLQAIMTDPELFARFEKGFMERHAQKKTDNTDLHAAQKKLNQVTVQIDRVVNAIAAMETTSSKALTDKLEQLEQERAGLDERVRLLQAESNVVSLHPTAVKSYREKLIQLLRSITGTVTAMQDHAAFRMMIEAVVVHRTAKRMPYEITSYARIGGALDANLTPPKRATAEVLAEAGVSYCCKDNTGKPLLAISQYKVICLGRWKQAA